MKDVMTEETFEYFNRDLNLLILHILLEGFYRGQNIFPLDQFLKGEYWTVEEIKDEIVDTSDYSSVEDLVIHQILEMISDFELGSVEKICLNDLFQLTQLVVEKALNEESKDAGIAEYYTSLFDEVYTLRRLADQNNESNRLAKKPFNHTSWDSLDFSPDNFERYLKLLPGIVPKQIEFHISFDSAAAHLLDEAIEDYVFGFSQDDYVEKVPAYREKRPYFSQQLENFYAYISQLPVIEGVVNIPFSALNENGFEVIKVLACLERGKRLKVRNWNDTNVWNVKFHSLPITLDSLAATAVPDDTNLTTRLSFDEAKSQLEVGAKTVKVRKGSDQYHLLRIILKDAAAMSKEWFYSEISEEYDQAAPTNDKKFYNAAYQVKQKIVRDTGLQDVFVTTVQSIRINPLYVDKT